MTTSLPSLDTLTRDARALLGWLDDDALPIAPSAIEGVLRNAHARVVSELGALERGQRTNTPVDYPKLFESHYHEKVAALLLLLLYTLRDLALDQQDLLDYEFSHRDATLYVEILYRIGAVEALQHVYEFAMEQGAGTTGAPAVFWENIALHSLLFLALMPNVRPYVIPFMLAHPAVSAQYKKIAGATQANVTEQIKALFADARQALATGAPPPPPPAPYL